MVLAYLSLLGMMAGEGKEGTNLKKEPRGLATGTTPEARQGQRQEQGTGTGQEREEES